MNHADKQGINPLAEARTCPYPVQSIRRAVVQAHGPLHPHAPLSAILADVRPIPGSTRSPTLPS
ncbi:conserved hypothetical protein [Aeromonas salmonicida]|nr:conserved hypothetical protein [Aeromonas salmonicida]